MANVENRAAEHGSEILEGAGTLTASNGKPFVAIKVIEEATFTTVVGDSKTIGIDYYDGKTISAGETLLGNFQSVIISGGVIQAIFS